MVPTWCATCQGYGTQILLMHSKKPTVQALDRKTRKHVGVFGGQRKLLFLTFSVLVANSKKLVCTVADPASGLLNREREQKKKSDSALPQAVRLEKVK